MANQKLSAWCLVHGRRRSIGGVPPQVRDTHPRPHSTAPHCRDRGATGGGVAAPAPDQMGSAILFHPTKQQPEMVPDPLRTELRTLAALAGGGRYALVPAGLTFRRATAPGGGPGGVGAQHAAPLPRAVATAELTVVLVDVRTGR